MEQRAAVAVMVASGAGGIIAGIILLLGGCSWVMVYLTRLLYCALAHSVTVVSVIRQHREQNARQTQGDLSAPYCTAFNWYELVFRPGAAGHI
jgi:hypothetical protein